MVEFRNGKYGIQAKDGLFFKTWRTRGCTMPGGTFCEFEVKNIAEAKKAISDIKAGKNDEEETDVVNVCS